jgi:Arc/MetJ-type ribon-helix-helix transcriptional regulator
MIYGVKRTTIYLPDELKAQLEATARAEGRTEADVIREALADALTQRMSRRPRLPLTEPTGEQTNWAEQVDELLDAGFGRS